MSGVVGFVEDLDTSTRRAKLRLLACVREAHIDNIPCLQSLLSYLAEHGFEVEVLCTQDPRWLRPTDQQPEITYRVVTQRVSFLGRSFRVPVTVALLAEGLARCRGPRRPDIVLSCGALGGIAAWMLAKLLRVRRIYQMLELPVVDAKVIRNSMPAIPNSRNDDQQVGGDRSQRRPRPWSQRLIDAADRHALRTADVVIAHDTYRADFSSRALQVPATRFELLPNAPRGRGPGHKTRWLAEKLGIPSDYRIALHFGGMSPHFDLLRLVAGVEAWPRRWCLVIHTSFRAEGEEYFEKVRGLAGGKPVFFSLDPVPSSTADELVASADVGLATYSLELLGYRATLMGLASGKIARYLRCGLPVVASDLPTVRKYLERYDCGYCAGDPAGFGALLPLISDRYNELSRNASRCFKELFAPDAYCRKIAERLAAMQGHH